MLTKPMVGRGLLALFVLSGLAGLIYQSVWSHYLGLTLGHAAYAQSLVLAIYMGGMALGAWLASRFGVRWKRLILAYAIVEAAIGLIGLLFHGAFVGYTALSQDVVLPRIGSDWLAQAWQWSSAALLIAPQSVLLGMTFPLMSGGYLRIAPKLDGEILGGLYFTNSIGAASGALFCTFVLLPWIGMPGTVRVAGGINLIVALLAACLALAIERFEAAEPSVRPEPAANDAGGIDRTRSWMLVAAFVTGATSFVYEIGWVRMLNQALGTTVHSFELMLSAFILGLAFGGLWIRQRSARIDDPIAATGHAQIWMGIAALLSVPMFVQSFRWVGWMMGALARNASGYVLFNAGSAAIAMLVMFPAAVFAGMTLPLMTVALLRRGHGESSIGRIYAANTLGAIVGVFVSMHVLIPAIGVGLSVTLAAFGDLVLGLLLLRYLVQTVHWRGYGISAVCGVLAVILSLHFGRPDPHVQVAGVFRTGNTSIPGRVVYLRDGKTATVSVYTEGAGGAAIATNGKIDAGLEIRSDTHPVMDEITMRMAAALPLAIHPRPRDVAVIGWGSGLTTATLLDSPAPASVTTIEIEPAMYSGARLLGDKVARGYTDPRSHVQFDDARTYFSTGNRQYDVIFSEPSNPWVNGVASLFTSEFYGLARRHLRQDGLMVQWVQSYELNDRLLGTMVAALLKVFPHVDVYLTNTADLIFVASEKPLPAVNMSALMSEPLRSELMFVGLGGQGDFAVRRIGSERVLQAFVRYTGVSPHSDYYPVVSLEAPRARFMEETSDLLKELVTNGMPVLDILDHRTPPASGTVIHDDQSPFAMAHWLAWDIALAMRSGEFARLQLADPGLADGVRALVVKRSPTDPLPMAAWYAGVSGVAGRTIGMLPARDLEGVWINPAWTAPDALPAPAQAVMAAFDAASRRDGQQLRPRALAALEQLRQAPDVPDVLREQMLVLAMLGAISDGQPAQAGAMEQIWGGGIPQSATYGPIRIYLQAWADMLVNPAR